MKPSDKEKNNLFNDPIGKNQSDFSKIIGLMLIGPTHLPDLPTDKMIFRAYKCKKALKDYDNLTCDISQIVKIHLPWLDNSHDLSNPSDLFECIRNIMNSNTAQQINDTKGFSTTGFFHAYEKFRCWWAFGGCSTISREISTNEKLIAVVSDNDDQKIASDILLIKSIRLLGWFDCLNIR